jgi:iron complex transport system substrate-binding protein
MTGREITLDKPAEKVVALTASDCEILFAIDAGSTLVGRGEYCDYPAEVLDIPAVQSGDDTNIEQIIALDPDVVIMSTMAQTTEQVESLAAVGIAVVVSDAHDIAGVYDAITLIGAITGKTDEASDVIGAMQSTFDDIKSKVPADSGKTIYFEVSPLQYGLWTAGGGTFMDELATMLGLTNIFADLDSWQQVSEEQVIDRNPDYIITTTMSFEGAPDPIDEINSRAGWESITAILNGNVMNANSNAITRPGPRCRRGAGAVWLHLRRLNHTNYINL